MASWIPSHIQKRLLRHVLLQIEVFDANSLDLEQLDIAWGRVSALELRDVALNVKKVSKLAGLPDSFQPIDGRIKLLRITVPANIFTNGIKFEVEGVEVNLRSINKSSQSTGETTPRHDFDGQIPTAKEVAEAFIAEESEAEIQELEAVILAQSVANLDGPTAYSRDVSDVEEGTGIELALPAFLAGFLSGIKDRFEVTIRNVALLVAFDIASQDLPSLAQSGQSLEASIGLHIEELDMLGTVSQRLDGAVGPQHKRYIHLKDMRLDLTSYRSFFSSLSQVTSRASPVTSRGFSSPAMSRSTHSRSPELADESVEDVMMASMMQESTPIRSEKSSSPSGSTPMAASQPEPSILGDSIILSSHSPMDERDRYADATDDEGDDHESMMSSLANISDTHDEQILYESRVFPMGLDVSGLQESELLQSADSLATPQADYNVLNPLEDSQSSFGLGFLNQPKLNASQHHSNSFGSDSTESSPDELSESKLFSHDEAQSMYESALSIMPSIHYSAPSQPPMESEDKALVTPSTTASPVHPEDLNEQLSDTPRPRSVASAQNYSARHSSAHRAADTRDINSPVSPTDTQIKTLFCLDSVTVKLPWSGTASESIDSRVEDEVGLDSADQFFASMPGAFEEGPDRSTKGKMPADAKSVKGAETERRSQASPSEEPNKKSILSDIEIELEHVQVQMDLPAGRLILVLVEQILTTLDNLDKPRETDNLTSPKVVDTTIALAITVRRMRLSLQERLRPLTQSWSPVVQADALLDLRLQDTNFQIRKTGFFMVVDGKLGDFALGIPGQDIISFGRPSNTNSSYNMAEATPYTIEMKYVRSRKHGQELHVITEPLNFTIDMQKIDDRLECYGGLSGVLDISSSIASQSTILAPPPRSQSSVVQPRRHNTEGNSVSPFIASISIHAVIVNVQGRSCGVLLQGRNIKAELTQRGVSVSLPRFKLKGPIIKNSSRRHQVTVLLNNTLVEFLFAPEEEDLTHLLSLLVPTRDPYEEDDDILVDTLLRQRKKGSVVRASIEDIDINVSDLDAISKLQSLGQELSKLSNVTKYLPDDDRPGLLTILFVPKIRANVKVNQSLGKITAEIHAARLAHVGLPALLAVQMGSIAMSRHEEQLVGSVLSLQEEDNLPMVMLKVIGDELEPTIKIKLFNIGIEYRVSTLMSIMGMPGNTVGENVTASMVSSIATIRGEHVPTGFSRQSSSLSDASPKPPSAKQVRISVLMRDCAAGLNPSGDTSRAIFLLSNAHVTAYLPSHTPISGEIQIRKASLLAIDDTSILNFDTEPARRSRSTNQISPATSDLARQGYKIIGTLSTANINFHAEDSTQTTVSAVVVGVNCELLVLETCADSTATLIQLMEGLRPPSLPSAESAYYNDPIPAADLVSSFSGATFEGSAHDLARSNSDHGAPIDLGFEVTDEFEVVGSLHEEDFLRDSDLEESSVSFATEEGSVPTEPVVSSRRPFSSKSLLATGAFEKSHSLDDQWQVLGSALRSVYAADAIHGWNSASNSYGIIPGIKMRDCPLQLTLHIQTFMWNLYDGYDWARTREVIHQAVENVQSRAAKRRDRESRRNTVDSDAEDVSEVGDFLFQSIWIAVPPNKDEQDLRKRINREMEDITSETGTTTTTGTHSTTRPAVRQHRNRVLKLDRSKRHKVSIEINKFDADVLILPPSVVETQSSINVNVGDLEIYDHIPSSTWRKFLTYMHDSGSRSGEKPMIRLELQNVKPKPELAATEIVMRVTVQPLRLHVDQDTLDFITRFFEFKDTSRVQVPKIGEEPFIQRIEIRAVPLKLDYKPKKIDYAGLRSGHTKEFMNFIILDGAEIRLKRLIIFGIAGFDKLHQILNDLWVADVTSNQLPVVLQGLAPLRPIVNVGTGIRNLIIVPMSEYQKDGRLVRSIGKGAVSFAKTTTSELARLGARVAIGTGNMLQGAETLLSPGHSSLQGHGDDHDSDNLLSTSPSSRAVSSYANQPLTVASGLRHAARHLERDLVSARDAIIAVGTDFRDSENAGDLAWAIMRSAPAVILKPAIGTSKALGTALLGAGNALDADSRRRLEDKYKD